MGLSDVSSGLSPATNLLKAGSGGLFAKIMSYAWVLFPLIIIGIIIGVVIIIKTVKKKNSQWTHKLKIRRVIQGGLVNDKTEQNPRLSEAIYIRMRRFPLIKNVEIFELEDPLLGGYLIPELDSYSGENEFSVIIDTNNRLYTNKGEFFDPDKNCVNVSAKHAEIDLARSQLKSDFQNINRVSKRVEWATIAKYAFFAIFILAVMVVILVGLSKWGESKQYEADKAQAEALTMIQLGEAMKTMEAVVNTQQLLIVPMLKKEYGTNDLSKIINQNKRDLNKLMNQSLPSV